MTGVALGKYGAVAATAARRTLAERAELAGRAAFLVVILFIFSRVWRLVLSAQPMPHAGPSELVWYLAITEWCVLSVPQIHLRIEADVRSGDVACELVRPLSYVGGRLAEATGDAAVRLLVLAPVAALAAALLAGGGPPDPRGLGLAAPLGLLSSTVAVLSATALGLSAFWLVDTSPVVWIWQKLVFVLGGLLLPLDIYPAWLRTLARCSPFPAMLYGPGRMAFGWAPRDALATAVELVAWSAAAGAALGWLARRAVARLSVHGG
jgi:ABC-2 type transport system permease protein